MMSPQVSVLITTYNRAHFVGDAIASVLGQTLREIEVIVVDDGSTDTTQSLLASIKDPRLRIVRHDRNRGIPATRNTALGAARGEYIAWLDSDDIARPTRLAEQVAFLECHPEIAMVGACAGKIRPDGTRKKGIRIPPFSPELIAAWLLFRSAFQQSSVMGRASVLQNYAYDLAFPVCEDMDMFARLQRDHRLANLPRVLVDRRLHPDQSVRTLRADIADRSEALARPVLARLGMDVTDENLKRHVMLGRLNIGRDRIPPDFLRWTKQWMNDLQRNNERLGILDPGSLALACDYSWAIACRVCGPSIGVAAATRAFVTRRPGGLVSTASLGWFRKALPPALKG